MVEYVLHCPNALKNAKKGLTISTEFIYNNLQSALEHKALCDQWDKENGREPRTYITEQQTS